MREILFRGKRKDIGEWVEGFYVKGDYCLGGETMYMIFPLDTVIYPHCEVSEYYEVDPETVGQYTGLTDRNGKRIFEGDICRNTKTGEVVSVKWHGTFAGFVWSRRNDNGNLCDFGELFRAHDKYEVIGNIHDNPELMRGGEQDATD